MQQEVSFIINSANISWQVPEYEKPERDKRWYIIAAVLAMAMLLYAFVTDNFLFMGIIILTAFILFLHDSQEPEQVTVALSDEGVVIGRKFYDYDELKNFGIVYKPNIGAKNLYFEFKSPMKQRLSIPLMEQDPLVIRKELLRYLPEDLDRTNRPLSEQLSRLLKI